MAYFAPKIEASGLSIPTYTDIRDDLLAKYKSIYGSDVYLGNDAADYQWISVVAVAISDALQSLQLAYNSRSPLVAIGAALDSLVKINGLTRKLASKSTCTVKLTGVPEKTILSGVVGDLAGNKWDLPVTCLLGSDGIAYVTATCQEPGAIYALPGDIIYIITPQAGWHSVTNEVAAVAGLPVEKDSELRARQKISVQIPSRTMLSGTKAAIAAVPGVTRFNVVENNTHVYDALGNPPHSITCVVEGGTDLDVATAIYKNRSIGCNTNGTTTVNVVDPDSGKVVQIKFIRPTYISIYVSIDLSPIRDYTTAVRDSVKTAICKYLNSLEVGEDLTISSLYSVAQSVMPDITKPLFSITSLKAGLVSPPVGTIDISIDFDEVTWGDISNIVINDGV